MRFILSLLLVAIVVVIILIMTDVINITQTQGAALPELEASGGQLPEFNVDTPEVEVGTETREIEVPTLEVRSADEAATDEALNAQ